MGNFTDAGPNHVSDWPARNLKGIPFESITATDDATVVMKLTEPRLDFLRLVLMNEATTIMPPRSSSNTGTSRIGGTWSAPDPSW